MTEWDSEHGPLDMHIRTIYRDGWLCSAYERSTLYDGTEGELYELASDPSAAVNRWDDPALRSLRTDLVADLYDHLPPRRTPRLERKAPV